MIGRIIQLFIITNCVSFLPQSNFRCTDVITPSTRKSSCSRMKSGSYFGFSARRIGWPSSVASKRLMVRSPLTQAATILPVRGSTLQSITSISPSNIRAPVMLSPVAVTEYESLAFGTQYLLKWISVSISSLTGRAGNEHGALAEKWSKIVPSDKTLERFIA